jgi:hypothetical protein
MLVTKIAASNYKCFGPETTFAFSAGVNVLVGENNVGKTSALELANQKFSNSPHRSTRTQPTPGAAVHPQSICRYRVELNRDEVLEHLAAMGTSRFVWAEGTQNADAATKWFLGRLDQGIALRFSRTGEGVYFDVAIENWERGDFCAQISIGPAPARQVKVDRWVRAGADAQFPSALAPRLQHLIYSFKAERLNIFQHPYRTQDRLEGNAANLPSVLAFLQANKSKWDEFNRLVSYVLPQVRWISVPPSRQVDGAAEIFVWSVPVESGRDDLAQKLIECGTGVGQILAIICVLMTATSPQVVVIDEPQSFLHPGAVRRLCQVLTNFSQHQFIVATHSTAFIAATQSGQLSLLAREGEHTTASTVRREQRDEMAAVLASVGARLADVFGAERMLWVEGRTEELCFPILMGPANAVHIRDTKIVGLVDTGGVTARDSARTLEIYRRLSGGQLLLPPACGFLLDRETLSDTQQADVTRESRGQVRFLGRRMYENYLLNPRAILTVLQEDGVGRALQVSDVQAILVRHGIQFDETGVAVPQSLGEVHGAHVLEAIFGEVGGSTIVYDKVKHGVKLTTWLAEHDSQALSDVRQLIMDCVRN